MTRGTTLLAAGIGVLAGLAGPGRAQENGGARLAPTTTSASAKVEFERALWHWQHAFPARAVAHLERALELDPQFGLARVFLGGLKPGLTPADRQAQMRQGVAALGGAPAGEVAVALAWREQWSSRALASRPLMAAAAELLPGDGQVTYWNLQRQLPLVPQEKRVESLRSHIQRFPQFPVTHRQLAYLLFRTGDRPGGLEAMREYVRIDPDHPNTHASLGELYHFAGQPDEAEREFRRANQLDSTWSGRAYLADIALVAGDNRRARTLWGEAVARSLSPVDSIDHQHTLALLTYLEGDTKLALTQLGELARRAEQRRFTANAALIHQRMAVLEVLAGNVDAVDNHLSRAAELGGDNTSSQHAYSSVAYAFLKRFDRARASAEKFGNVTAWPAGLFRHTLEGLIALREGDAAGASAHLAQSEPIDVLSRELQAQAYDAQGRRAEADSLRTVVRRSATMLYASHLMDFFSALAKVRAR